MVILREMADKHELSWSGEPAKKRSGGFVDGVGVNQLSHSLAVDPEGVVSTPTGGARSSGPQLSVERLGDENEGPVRPSGRVRLTPT